MSERRPIFRGRLRRPKHEGGDAEEEIIEIDPGALAGIFAAPKWMRDLGFSAWLLVGVAAALVGGVWLISLTQTIVMPVITVSPVVAWLRTHGVPRGIGAAAVFVAIAAIGAAVGLLVLGGIASQADVLSEKLRASAGEVESFVRGLGVQAESAARANQGASSSVSGAFQALTHGLFGAVDALAGLAVFLSFTALSLFFLLKDGPTIGRFVERHMGVPVPVAHTVLVRLAGSLRGYFLGVTVVAAWSAAIVGVGSLALGVPLAGTIAAVTFFGGYVPYLGAWAAGAFAVLIALGQGPEVALVMAIVVLAANGILQQLVQPIAYGAALKLHPLAVLIATIAGGCLFGTVGLVLAAPLVSATVRITDDLRKAERGSHPAEGGAGRA
jgi:predicted PurR-regulated permease PerM